MYHATRIELKSFRALQIILCALRFTQHQHPQP